MAGAAEQETIRVSKERFDQVPRWRGACPLCHSTLQLCCEHTASSLPSVTLTHALQVNNSFSDVNIWLSEILEE